MVSEIMWYCIINMSETPTTPPQEESEDKFDAILNFQATQAARSIVQAEAPQTPVVWDNGGDMPRDHSTRKAIIYTGAAVLTAAAGLSIGLDAQQPSYSDETKRYTVGNGEGYGEGYNNAAESILGSEKEDINELVHHIQADPANIDVIQGGLQPGEQLVVPVSVNGAENTDK
ncbi:MAG: hypothetical protein JWO54_511 [Candidatus Saccharibacteria bacterium]|nr:hypothetical protein [Candidatus Saccharibacteria bacterium]MDB5180751.1 hypothetical protein [Candidatus Saccharibacteria bacterium]